MAYITIIQYAKEGFGYIFIFVKLKFDLNSHFYFFICRFSLKNIRTGGKKLILWGIKGRARWKICYNVLNQNTVQNDPKDYNFGGLGNENIINQDKEKMKELWW